MTADKTKKWDYAPRREQQVESTIAIGTIGLYGLALSQIFNPLALGAAMAYATGLVVYGGKNQVKNLIKKGLITPLPLQYADTQTMVNEIGQSADIKECPTVYLIKDPDRYAASLPAENVVVVNEPFLDKFNTSEKRFVLAHEVSHIKAEDTLNSRILFGAVSKILIAAIYFSLAGSALGLFALPLVFAGGVSPAVGTALFYAASVTAYLGINYADRIMERRADRNAIHLTRDVEAATSALHKTYPDHQNPAPFIEISSHPSYHPRVANLHKAFREASTYPAPLTVVNKTVQPVKPASHDMT